MKVSVVTPFYNTAPYLDECIRSVRAQTFEDFEYLLVDNGSTDASLQIALRHAKEDPRIHVLSNATHLDQVSNYNLALSSISGDSLYCKLVQADDWIHSHCLEDMVALADSNPRVGIVSSFRLLGRMVAGTGLPYTCSVINGREVCRWQLLSGQFFFGSPTTVMFRSELVRSQVPFYELGRLHEDTEKCYQVLQDWDFGFVHQVLSFSRTDNESIMSQARRFNAPILDRLIVIERFGPSLLSAPEFARCKRDHDRAYLRYLGAQWLRRPGKEFWDYHRKGLASIGRTLSFEAIFAHAAIEVLRRLANPGETLARAYDALRRRATKATTASS